MEMQGDHSFGNYSTCNGDNQETVGDKFVPYSPDQVNVLENFFVECEKPSHTMRLAMIHENSVLSNLDSQQIQAWFDNRRFLEKKKKEAFVFNLLNEKIAAIGRLLLLENVFLHREMQQLLRENKCIRKLLQYASLESFMALEVPRSVFKNVKMVAARRLLLLKNEYLHNEVQLLHRENEYIRNLLENLPNSNSVVNSYQSWYGTADSSKRLLLLSGTITKFPSKTPSARIWVFIPKMKCFGGLKEISVNTCSNLTYFSVSGIIIDVSVMPSFVKAAMIPDGPLDLLLRKHQEFILCCSLKDIKLVVQGSRESLTAVVPAFLPLEKLIIFASNCPLLRMS